MRQVVGHGRKVCVPATAALASVQWVRGGRWGEGGEHGATAAQVHDLVGSDVSPEEPLSGQGLDSLASMELRQSLQVPPPR